MNLDLSCSAFEATIQALNQPNPLEPLKKFSDMLLYAGSDINGLFIIKPTLSVLLDIFTKSTERQEKLYSAACISSIADSIPDVCVFIANLYCLQKFSEQVDAHENKDLVEHCIHLLNLVAQACPTAIGDQTNFTSYLSHYDQLDKINQHTVLSILERGSSRVFQPHSVSILEKLVELLSHKEESIYSDAAAIVTAITLKADLSTIPDIVIDKLSTSLLLIVDGSTMLCALRALDRMVTNDRLAQRFLNCWPDLPTFYSQISVGAALKPAILQLILHIAIQLAPPAALCGLPFIQRTLTGSVEFVLSLFNFVGQLLLSGTSTCVTELLYVLASCANLIDVAPLTPLITTLLVIATQKQYVDTVHLVFANFRDKSILRGCSTCEALEIGGANVDWLRQQIGDPPVVVEDWPTISNEAHFLELSQRCIPHHFFYTKNMIERTTKFLKGIKNQPTAAVEPAILAMVAISKQFLGYISIPQENDPFGHPNGLIRTTEFTVDILYGTNRDKDINLDAFCDFASVEQWWNRKNNNFDDNHYIKFIQQSPYGSLIEKAEYNLGSLSKNGMICRGMKSRAYKRFHFKVEDKIFHAWDNVYQSIVSTVPYLEKLRGKDITIELLDGDGVRGKPEIRPCVIESKFLNFLQIIHQKFPSIDLIATALGDHSLSSLQSVALTYGLVSPAISLIYTFPFLFTFPIRHLVFQMTGLDLEFASYTAQRMFVHTSQVQKFKQLKVRLKIDRKNLFGQGCLILDHLSGGRCHWDIGFSAELGVGSGPTNEFFDLLSKEFCRNSLDIWRTDDPSAEFAYQLFPKFTADPQMLYRVGVLCAKALLMDSRVSFPFNPAFFKLVRGKKVAIEEVDPQLAKSLQSKADLIGLPFDYPGTEINLKVGCNEITAENVDFFVSEVVRLTVDLFKLASEFKEGFSTVIVWETLNLFSEEEICRMICGDGATITRVDLVAHLIFSHGYASDSPQSRWLIEVIDEFNGEEKQKFVKFVTGTVSLPIGGIAALKPRLEVAPKMIDDEAAVDISLPTVMTCANYLKLPKYSKKEILAEKLKYAIYHCQNSFELS